MSSADRRHPIWGAIGAGVALGLLYAASPLTVITLCCLAAIFWWAGRGLETPERLCVYMVLAVAVGVRLLVIALLFVTSAHDRMVSFPWDGDGVFLKRRALLISSSWSGVPLDPQSSFAAFDHSYGWTSYQYVLAYLQHLIGSAPYAIHVLSATLFVASAVALFRLCRACYGHVAAFLGLTALLFLPTLMAWSVSAMKESLYLLLSTAGVVAAVTCIRARDMRLRALALAVLVGAVSANHTVRAGAAVIMAAGLAVGIVAASVVRRPLLLCALLVAAAVALPVAARRPALRDQLWTQLTVAAERHIGNTRTEGHGYKLLDQRVYSSTTQGQPSAVTTMTHAEKLRFLIRALASIILVPLPWSARSTSEIVLLAQQALWYVMVAFAVIGVYAGVRRDALVTLIFTATAVVGGVIIALSNGNIGTLVRFRDTLVPFVVWLSAVGAVASVRWLMPGEAQAVTAS